ncbi:MAG: DUF3592 domain-containing protein [Spirosomataceae bacterium]
MKIEDKSWFLFSGVFAFIGVVCLTLAYYNYWLIQKTIENGIETEGVIIAHRRENKINRTTALAVVVAYKNEKGEPRVYYSTTYTTPVAFQIGEQVSISYNPNDPNDVILHSPTKWLIPLVLGGFGIVFSLIGLPTIVTFIIGFIFRKG